MREIKFRAWNVATKVMVDLKKITPLALNIDTNGLFIPFSDGLPLMQYTGLKDKNGKECYEKDFDDDGNMIDFCDRCCGYQFFQIDEPTKDVVFCHSCEGNFMLQDHITDFKIIGNIYEGRQEKEYNH